MKFFPDFVYRELAVWSFCLILLAFLAVFYPFDSVFIPLELQEKASAFDPTPLGIKPEWYFMFMFQTLKFLPPIILFFEGEVLGIAAFSLCGAALLFWPFIERKSRRGQRQPLVYILGIAALIFIVVLTVIGYTRG